MLAPGDEVDRYTVQAELGRGGQAVVYRVLHRALDCHFALKVLKIRDARLIARLRLEGSIQARLRHPNIVAVTDVVDVGGVPGLVMELVDGPSLDTWLHDRAEPGALDTNLIDEVFGGIVAAVEHAHAHGVLHRDLKPANVLLPAGTENPRVKVTDFGLAKLLVGGDSPFHTRSGVPVGTPCYMAPEQVRGRKGLDERADMFSLGCILYELCCGQRAFGGDGFGAMQAIVAGSFTPPEAWRPDLPERYVVAIRSLLQVEPERRPRNCAALRTCLWPAAAPPAPPRERAPSRRHVFAPVVGALLFASAAGGWATWALRPAPTRPFPSVTGGEPPARVASVPPLGDLGSGDSTWGPAYDGHLAASGRVATAALRVTFDADVPETARVRCSAPEFAQYDDTQPIRDGEAHFRGVPVIPSPAVACRLEIGELRHRIFAGDEDTCTLRAGSLACGPRVSFRVEFDPEDHPDPPAHVEVRCGESYRQRFPVVLGVASPSGVPNVETFDCRLYAGDRDYPLDHAANGAHCTIEYFIDCAAP